MTATEIAGKAIRDTQHLAGIVSYTVRERLAIAEVAITVSCMDESTHAAVRLMRLEDGIAAVREMLEQNA